MNTRPSDSSGWFFGAATVDITPREPILLTGYFRAEPTTAVRNPIHAKAAYFRAADGAEAVILNAEVIGFSEPFTTELSEAIEATLGIRKESIILSATHNHSAPVIEGVLELFHDFTPEDKAAQVRYTRQLFNALLRAAHEATANAEECTLAHASGIAGIGANRRRAASHLRELPPVVDQDVPVLLARNRHGTIRGILFGYACHTTVMFDNIIDGDYSGYAQAFLEEAHPGSTALFLAGCGGDINPLPRRRIELSEMYGKILGLAVLDAIATEATFLPDSSIISRSKEIALPLKPLPSLEFLEQELEESTLRERVIDSQFRPMPSGIAPEELEHLIALSMEAQRRKVRHQLDLRRQGKCAPYIRYSIQVLELGNLLRLVTLPGEPVVDYSLRIKERNGFLTTWPLGYCGHLVAYIPSLRVYREGGYEAKTAMMEYGHPSIFSEAVESLILDTVDSLLTALPPRAIADSRPPLAASAFSG